MKLNPVKFCDVLVRNCTFSELVKIDAEAKVMQEKIDKSEEELKNFEKDFMKQFEADIQYMNDLDNDMKALLKEEETLAAQAQGDKEEKEEKEEKVEK